MFKVGDRIKIKPIAEIAAFCKDTKYLHQSGDANFLCRLTGDMEVITCNPKTDTAKTEYVVISPNSGNLVTVRHYEVMSSRPIFKLKGLH